MRRKESHRQQRKYKESKQREEMTKEIIMVDTSHPAVERNRVDSKDSVSADHRQHDKSKETETEIENKEGH